MTVPRRTCIGCRRRDGIDQLVRFVRTPEGSVRFGRTLAGRGAWLCVTTLDECATLAVRRRAVERALRGPVDPTSFEAAVRAAAGSVRGPGENARG